MRIQMSARRRGLVIIVVILSLLMASSCEDSPTRPRPAREYLAYFYSGEAFQNWYFIYNPVSKQVDSVFLPYYRAPVISADNDFMFVRDDVAGQIDVLTTDSFKVVGHLPFDSPLTASRDGRRIAVLGDGVHLLDTRNYLTIYSDSSLKGGKFAPSSDAFYGLPITGHIKRISLSPGFHSELITVPFGSVFEMAIAPDESKLFLYLQTPTYFHFVVLDPVADSVLFDEPIWPGFGDLAMTPDGRQVFYTNAGTMIGPTPGDKWITVFDVESNQVTGQISSIGILDPPYDVYGVYFGELCMFPDGKTLVALPSPSFPFVFAINTKAQTIEHIWSRMPSYFFGLTCNGEL